VVFINQILLERSERFGVTCPEMFNSLRNVILLQRSPVKLWFPRVAVP
jgi:hypothetical protein